MARNNNTERLTEALCLEARSPRSEMKSKKLALKALNQKGNLSASCLLNDACTLKPFRRRSRSWDLNVSKRLVLSPSFETSSTGTIYHMKRLNGQNANPPVYTQSGLQLESNSIAFQEQYRSNADKLQKRIRDTSFTTLVHRGIESECDFEAAGQSSGSAIADGSPFVMNISSSVSAVEEEQYIAPVGLVQPTNTSVNQKLSKRERNKLKSLRRKQRRREQWLQKQVGV